MKRTILLSALLMMISHFGLTQTNVGVLVGGNVASLKAHGVCLTNCDLVNERRNEALNYQIGLSFEHEIGSKILLTTDLLFSKKSYGLRGYRNGKTIQQNPKVDLQYLSIPLQLQLPFQQSKIFAGLGLTTNVFLSSWKKANSETIETSDLWRPFDVGADLALGFRIREDLALSFGYYLGFFSIEKREELFTPGNLEGTASLRLQTFQLNMRYYPFS